MATAIKVENLSKIYRLGEIGTGTISRDIERFVKTKIFKQEDPFLKIGETNDRAIKGASDIVYSLKDINFEIEQGDAVGIIGRNGAGKSTLLKILSRVTSPTTGKISIKGRVASLLEVGTGFHPELTGRENIYLNGAILGMRKREIDRKLDEIIDFSGVERYIDTPVKRYSSGMYVRLAFAVAAHLESEILIVDEVLAVGDAEFQKKCLGKMGEVSKGEGRTVLFVSHNMGAVRNLCTKGISLLNGQLSDFGDVGSVTSSFHANTVKAYDCKKNKLIYISSVRLFNPEIHLNFHLIKKLNIDISVASKISTIISIELLLCGIDFVIAIIPFGRAHNFNHSVTPGVSNFNIEFDLPNLKAGKYYLQLKLSETNVRFLDNFDYPVEFEVVSSSSPETSWEFTEETHNDGFFLLNGISKKI